jgi:hypothetical protein
VPGDAPQGLLPPGTASTDSGAASGRATATALRSLVALFFADDGVVGAQVACDAVPAGALAELAHGHRLGAVVRMLGAGPLGWDEGRLAPYVASRTGALMVNMLALSTCRWLGEVLGAAGVDYVVVKGPVLSELAYPRPDLRPYGDLDVLVSRSALRPAVEALLAAGAVLVDRNWPLASAQQRAELSLRTPTGFALDLHWHLINHPAERARFRLNPAEMLERRVNRTLGGVVVPCLDDEDQLLHLALHAVLSGGHLLQWTVDFVLWARERAPRTDVVGDRADRYALRLVLEVMQRRVAHVVGQPLVQLVPPGSGSWLALVDAVDRLRPPGRPVLGRHTWSAVLGCTSSGDAASFGQLMRRLDARIGRSARGADDPTLAELHREVGGAAERAAYFRSVEDAPDDQWC